METKDPTTRREFLKTAALGAGLLISGEQLVIAQQRGRGTPLPPSGQGRGGPPPVSGTQGRGGGPLPILASNPSIQHHPSRCRRCGRCRTFCQRETTVFGRNVPPGTEACVHCGQCTLYCRRAITEKYGNYLLDSTPAFFP